MNRKDCIPTTHSVICIDHFGKNLSGKKILTSVWW